MFNFDSVSSAFGPPGIAGIEGLQRASAARQVAAARKSGALPATAAPNAAAKEDAAYWVDYAESRIASIGEEMRIYNHTKNRPPGYYEEMEAKFGAEIVEQSKFFDELSMQGSEMVLAAHDMLLRANFDVTGTIFEKNAAGDYQFGKFTIDRTGAGFAIHIDSEDGTKLAFNRGRFNHRFSRLNLPEFDRLPFGKHEDRRADLIA